jgi:hypothetical protein
MYAVAGEKPAYVRKRKEGNREENHWRNRRNCDLYAYIRTDYYFVKSSLYLFNVFLGGEFMQFTLEEIIDLAAEMIGACFFIAVFWQFTAGGLPYSLAAIVEKIALSLGG